jgi:hypothetical protein
MFFFTPYHCIKTVVEPLPAYTTIIPHQNCPPNRDWAKGGMNQRDLIPWILTRAVVTKKTQNRARQSGMNYFEKWQRIRQGELCQVEYPRLVENGCDFFK